MKKSLLVLVAIIFAINLNTQAEDFSAVYNGDTIYYKITSSTSPYTVAVTNSCTTVTSKGLTNRRPDFCRRNGRGQLVPLFRDKSGKFKFVWTNGGCGSMAALLRCSLYNTNHDCQHHDHFDRSNNRNFNFYDIF